MNIKEMAIGKLKPANYNPREELKEGDKEFELLKENILKYGFVQPIIINTTTGNIVGGHQRLNVAKALNMKKVPVTEVELSLEEEKKLNISLNKVSGRWDEDKLGALLADLKGAGEDLNLTGFDEFEIEELTLAFSDVNLDTMTSEFESGEVFTPYQDETAGINPSDVYSGTEEQSGGTERAAVIKYEIIFDNESQQATWHEFLKFLKSEMDLNEFPTHASRIQEFIEREVL